jgi:hypothetical protein
MPSSVAHYDRVRWESQQADGQVLLSPSWEVFVLCISVLSVFNLFFGWVIQNDHILQVVIIMDSVLTIVFVADLARRLIVADDAKRYLIHGYGWIDLLSTFPLLRVFRLFRIVRVVRILQRMGGARQALHTFFRNKAAGGLLSVLLIAILVLEFGSLAILWAEQGAQGASITSAEDAVWYLIVTMSTVGYGDMVPVTGVGRMLGSLIIVVGVGVFGTLTGFLANAFLAPSAPSIEVSAEDAPEQASDTGRFTGGAGDVPPPDSDGSAE